MTFRKLLVVILWQSHAQLLFKAMHLIRPGLASQGQAFMDNSCLRRFCKDFLLRPWPLMIKVLRFLFIHVIPIRQLAESDDTLNNFIRLTKARPGRPIDCHFPAGQDLVFGDEVNKAGPLLTNWLAILASKMQG